MSAKAPIDEAVFTGGFWVHLCEGEGGHAYPTIVMTHNEGIIISQDTKIPSQPAVTLGYKIFGIERNGELILASLELRLAD